VDLISRVLAQIVGAGEDWPAPGCRTKRQVNPTGGKGGGGSGLTRPLVLGLPPKTRPELHIRHPAARIPESASAGMS